MRYQPYHYFEPGHALVNEIETKKQNNDHS